MASAVSKRQQARNERALQDLIRGVPGNDRCADCSAKNPGWASWNLGIFLCMRCAALHRKLGTHISKVKSLSMDTWSADQVENMKNVGNFNSNKIYNPRNVRAEIPVDVDEVDSAIERYIRQKYDQRTLSTGATRGPAAARQNPQNTGSTGTDLGSWSEELPELPPKPTKRFGFSLRSSSAALPKQRQDRFTPPLSPAYSGSERSHDLPSPKRLNKPTQMFGMKITTVDNNFNAKLVHLRDMGFPNNSKNTEILKTTGGNVDKAVETLIRLGEGTKHITTSVTPAPRALTPGSRALTPVSIGSGTNGITVEKKQHSSPWDIRESSQPTIPARASSVPPQSTAANSSWNPFLPPEQSQSQAQLQNSFQNLQVSAQPNSSSYVWSNQGAYQDPNAQATNPFLQPQQNHSSTYPPPAMHQNIPSNQSMNPFLQQTAPQAQQQQPQNLAVSNPWSQPPAQQSGPMQSLNPWQQQGLIQQQPVASPQPIYGQQQDFFSSPQPPPQPQQQQQQQQPQQYQFSQPQAQPTYPPQNLQYAQQAFAQPQQTTRHDKSSILALYNYPQLAPQRSLQTLPEDGSTSQPLQQQYEQPPQRSVTMPPSMMTSGSMNPFGSAMSTAQAPRQHHHVSHESVDFQGLNGRQSPDAFAGLSARYMR